MGQIYTRVKVDTISAHRLIRSAVDMASDRGYLRVAKMHQKRRSRRYKKEMGDGSDVQFNIPRPWKRGSVNPNTDWNFFCNEYTMVPRSFGICSKICQIAQTQWRGYQPDKYATQ